MEGGRRPEPPRVDQSPCAGRRTRRELGRGWNPGPAAGQATLHLRNAAKIEERGQSYKAALVDEVTRCRSRCNVAQRTTESGQVAIRKKWATWNSASAPKAD